MVELGNFGVSNLSTQNKPQITYDTFIDTWSLKNKSRPNTTKIYQSFNLDIFTWKQEYIKDIFKKAEDNKDYTDYLVFLLQEEVYTLIETQRLWGLSPSTANGSSYTIEGVIIPKMPDAGEEAYLLALLKAWHALCIRLNKKSAILGCPIGYEPNPQYAFEHNYTKDGITYIAKNYDMVYIYRYPTTGKASKFGYRAKEYLEYWRNTLNYTGKINYNLDTFFGVYHNTDVGSLDYNTIKEDFINAADNGADIISCYKSINMLENDDKATARLLQIANEYQPNQCNQTICHLTIN